MKTISLDALQQIVKACGAKKELADKIIADAMAQSTERVGFSVNPPKEIDGVMHYFCRFTQTYHSEDKMVLSNGKSKGYSKAAISVWNKINAEIKKEQALIADAIMKSEEPNNDVVARLEKLKSALNNPSTYADLDNALINLGITTAVKAKAEKAAK